LNKQPLELRPNPSQWVHLLDIALPAIDYVFAPNSPGSKSEQLLPARPNWTLGGGTAIALRLSHRVSDDIDIFVSGVALKAFTPHRNPAARSISTRFEWPGHYLKFVRSEGEIDFLSSHLQTEPGCTFELFRNRIIALETTEEVIVKKIRYRSATFTSRDIFDLAAASRANPHLAMTLAHEVADVLPRLKSVIKTTSAGHPTAIRESIRAMPEFQPLLDTAAAEALAVIETAISLTADKA
jgi:hypothetical protein